MVLGGDRVLDCNQATLDYLGFNNKNSCIKFHPSQFSPEYQSDGSCSVAKLNQYIENCYQQDRIYFFWTHRSATNELIESYVKLLNISYDGKKLILATLIDFRTINQCFQGELHHAKSTESINYNLLNEHKKVIDFSSIVSKTNAQGHIIYANKNFCDITGYKMEELLGNDHSIINHPDVPKSLFSGLWKTIKSGQIWQGVIKNRKKNGESYFVDSTISPIFDTAGEIVEFIAIRNDITSLIEKEQVIFFQNTDRQTKLPNKTKLYNDLKEQEHTNVAVLDVFELEALNYVTSKECFSQLILDIVSHLSGVITKHISLYRTAEYQFTIVSTGEESIDTFAQFCHSIATEFEQTVFLNGKAALNLSLFIGIAQNVIDLDPYINASQATRLAEGTCQKINVFRPQQQVLKAIEESVNWTQRIKQALCSDDFTIFGQNIVDANQTVYSTEVLMRHYDKKTSTFTSPYFFLEHACKAKLYNKLTQLVMKKSFAHFEPLNTRFSVNVTYMDICDDTTMCLFEQLLTQYQCGHKLTIELVESDSLDTSSTYFKQFITIIKRFGCLLAIDDFGSGYSNFNYLTQLPVDIVKIDGSLIQDIDVNERHFVTVKAIVEICHALEIKVVAEYVASDAIYQKLLLLHIDYFQGFLFDQPSHLMTVITSDSIIV